MILDVLVDPNITQLPFAGLNYTDFDLFGTGMQFNGFFGGAYGQAAWSVPSLGGSQWQLAGSAFAVLARCPRSSSTGTSDTPRTCFNGPLARVALVRPLSPRVSLRLGTTSRTELRPRRINRCGLSGSRVSMGSMAFVWN